MCVSLFVFPGTMRYSPVTCYAVLWLLMLVPGSWGKCHFSLIMPASAWEARLQVTQASSLASCSRPPGSE